MDYLDNAQIEAQNQAREFLNISSQFRLGKLPTESPNPKSMNLSYDAHENLPRAIETIQAIDRDVFKKLESAFPQIVQLKNDIAITLKSNGRLFLCGCGATGRLSLALETLWRQEHKTQSTLSDQVISFMAGGDVALIHSVEKFEDYPEFGERQLLELGFRQGDLLISCTEGGETPFVIGATEAALNVSTRAPYFLYCNPDDILCSTTERSKRVIENNKIQKINLTVGPMALTGSTRMQATTILMYAVGLAMWFYDQDELKMQLELKKLTSFVNNESFSFLDHFIKEEVDIYKRGEFVYYETNGALGISILTDTTERSPTFSLYPFENQNDSDSDKNPSLSYLLFSHAENAESAWFELLGRFPRTFHWREITDQTALERLSGFDFSKNLMEARLRYLKVPHSRFKIFFHQEKNELSFSLNQISRNISMKDLNFLSTHMVLKMLLNNMSTLIMGRMDRYESNLMTWVRASNNKLVDRAVRYVGILLRKKGIEVSYEDLVKACFRLKDQTPRDQSLVLRLVSEFSS